MTSDPVRAVRIEAARSLAGPAETGIAAADRPAFAKALDEYIAVQMYNADRPEGRMSLGNLYATRGDLDRAIAEYRKALAIEPTFVAGVRQPRRCVPVTGADSDAEATLRQGLAREPKAAALHYALGLALVRQKKTADALKELAEAARLDAGNARYAYVYAVALTDAGRGRDALQLLAAARKRHPYDRDVLEGLAHYTLLAGDRDGARGYVKELRELDPDNPGYAGLAAKIEGRATP